MAVLPMVVHVVALVLAAVVHGHCTKYCLFMK